MVKKFQSVSDEHFLKELEQEKIILSELEKEAIENSIEIEKKHERAKKIILKNIKLSSELEQEKEILEELNKIISINKDEMDKFRSERTKTNSVDIHTIKELEQEKEFLLQLNYSSEEVIEKLNDTNLLLEEKVSRFLQKSKELEQEGMTQNEIIKEQTIKLSKKQSTIISLAVVGIVAIVLSSFLFVTVITGQQYKVENTGNLRSGYVIQNLKGDTIDTWLSWRLIDGSTLNVNLVDGQKYPDKAEIVRTVLLSEESIEIDDSLLHKGPKGVTSTYYVGWAGALADAARSPTEMYIPHKFNLIESQKGEGEITIRLTTMKSGDGYSGYTKSIADDVQNQILKSEITIFEVDKLSKAQFETILRHELGHALGLAHSTAPEDLMHPTIETDYPYISQCNIDAMVSLYDGGKKSEVVCEK